MNVKISNKKQCPCFCIGNFYKVKDQYFICSNTNFRGRLGAIGLLNLSSGYMAEYSEDDLKDFYASDVTSVQMWTNDNSCLELKNGN